MKTVKQTKRAAGWRIAYDVESASVTLTKTDGQVVTVRREGMSEAAAAMAWCYGVCKTAQNHSSLPADEETGKVDQMAREAAAETFLRRIGGGGDWTAERTAGTRGPVWTLACKILLKACELSGESVAGKREMIQAMGEDARMVLLDREDHRLSPWFGEAREGVLGQVNADMADLLDAL